MPSMVARISPDRSEILYMLAPARSDPGGPVHVMAMPVNGGSPREVLRGVGVDDIQCARMPANFCVYLKADGDESVFTLFDPKTGATKPGPKIPIAKGCHGLSPDGATLAMAAYAPVETPAKVYLYSLRDGGRKTITLEGWGLIEYLDWHPDGKSFWISAQSVRNVGALVRVDLQGKATPFYYDAENQVGWASLRLTAPASRTGRVMPARTPGWCAISDIPLNVR
jgi:hypothetical protein